MLLTSIVAMGKNRVIGKGDKLPWNIPSEHEHYIKTIGNFPYLIGRKNFEINKEFHQSRNSIVLSRKKNLNISRPYFNELDEAIAFSEEKFSVKELFVVGGSEIYELTLPLITKLHLSIVDYNNEGDRYFPSYSSYEWNIKSRKYFDVNGFDTPLSWEYLLLEKVPDQKL